MVLVPGGITSDNEYCFILELKCLFFSNEMYLALLVIFLQCKFDNEISGWVPVFLVCLGLVEAFYSFALLSLNL